MKFLINAQDFKRALNTCNEIAPISSPIAAEKTGVLLETREDSVVFMASDDTMAVSVAVPAKIQEAGRVVVRCRPVATSVTATFLDESFDEKPATVKVEVLARETLKISGENRPQEGRKISVQRTFPLLNADFFIETPVFEEDKSTQIPTFYFMDGLSRVGYAASRDVSKSEFNCITLSLSDNGVVFSATDGNQIAEFKKAVQVKNLRGSFALGLKFATIAAKLVNPQKFEFVNFYIEGGQIFLQTGGTTVVARLVNAEPLDYQQYLSKEGKLEAIFPREEFLFNLNSLQSVADAKSHRVVLSVNSRNGKGTLSSSSLEGAGDNQELEVKAPTDFVLNFSSAFLQNALRQMKGDKFSMYFTPEAKAVVLASPKDEDFTAVVCTLRVLN